MKHRNNTQLILHGSLVRAMLSIAVPVVISSMLQTMYNLTDTYWLGRIGTQPLAAINLVTSAIRDITLIYNSVSSAVEKVASAIALLGVEDTLRAMGTYLTDTAQEFQLAEGQNLACLQQWGV